MDDPGRVLIVGAGPTGLGCAWRLAERGVPDVTLLEASEGPGGLARSFVDGAGFTWDVGGHVQFSHYDAYDDVLDRALGDAWLHHERESWVWIRRRFVPYPFQNNIHRLDPAERDLALDGLERAQAAREGAPPENFGEWIRRTFGEGLEEIFLRPYNTKVWAYPPERLGVSWMGERVALPDVARIRRNIASGRDDVSWGPNSTFRFPKRGGTGAIWTAVAARLPDGMVRCGARVEQVDAAARTVALAGGERLRWDTLVSSMPLDRLCRMTTPLPTGLAGEGEKLVFSSTHVVGIGLSGPRPPALARKCWIYFPESHSPYYRVTVFSNYSPENVPPGDFWSLMAEVSESPEKPVDRAAVVGEVEAALRVDGLIPDGARVVSRFHHFERRGYPTPFVGRDAVVDPLLAGLESLRVFSRGRFGAWKYEVSNQDHSFMQGFELADRLLGEGDEPTLRDPDRVNGGAFRRR